MTKRQACELDRIETASGRARMMANNIERNFMAMGLAGQDNQIDARSRATAIAWGVVMLAVILAYWPGLQGPFVFDDFKSLRDLGYLSGVKDWDSFMAFVFGGTSGPTGRPLALASFLIDGNNWPTDPWPFKRTNLVIHLLNGVLLGAVTRQILQLLDFDRESAARLALVSAAAWLLHPFLVSTTLYAVQRMTQLAMLFSIGGMITYLYGRSLLGTNKTKAYLVMTVSLGVFTVLATLSKENGALLPMLIGVVEITIFASRGDSQPRLDRRWSFVFLGIPSMFIVGFLGYAFFSVDFLETQGFRDFSIFERLLTQPRVVADYLQNWFLPKLYTTGVFQDHVMKSTGLLAPVSTAVAAAFHIGLIVLAFVKRRQLPLLAFAILFFYSSHLLESTVLNLEMYFEHRNYLPAAFLFLPLIVFVNSKVEGRKAFVVGVVILAALGGFTRYSATVWSDYNSMIEASAYKAPTSARAQVLYARQLLKEGHYDASLSVIDRAAATIQNSTPLLQISRALIRCSLGRLSESDMDELVSRLAPLPYDGRKLELYEVFVDALAAEQCVSTGTRDMYRLFSTMLEDDESLTAGSLSLSHVHYLSGLTALRLNRPEDAMEHFLASVSAQPKPSPTMKMADLMFTSKYFAEALELSGMALRQIEEDQADLLDNTNPLENSIHEFRKMVRAELNAAD